MTAVLKGSSLFLADDFSSQDNLDDPEAGGWDATLIGEEEDEFFELQVVKQHDGEVNRACLRKPGWKGFLSPSHEPFVIISRVVI